MADALQKDLLVKVKIMFKSCTYTCHVFDDILKLHINVNVITFCVQNQLKCALRVCISSFEPLSILDPVIGNTG